MTPGFWLMVAMVAIVAAAALVWLVDRLADARDWLAARDQARADVDAATFGEPTRAQVEADWSAHVDAALDLASAHTPRSTR